MLLDSWARGTIDEYPELFSEVLMLCAAVPRENRKRAIVLNMWRSRLSVFFSTFSTDIPRVTIVDEGLGQSVLSLLWARASPGEWDTPGQIQMAKALLRALPRQRIMIFVDTPVDTLLKRRVRNQHLGREVLVTTREIAQAIVRETKAHGTSVIHLDGSKPPERICADLQTALGQLGHREIIFGG
jgi:riboflavin biosynthesis pyrimidine reductase